MSQTTLAEAGFAKYHRQTRKEKFLARMDTLIPWKQLCALIAPYYPKPSGAGRRPVGVERMLRIHFLQHGFNLSDPAMEEALYDTAALRRFAGIDLGREPAPDETTICKFRHLLERHALGAKVLGCVNKYLAEQGMQVRRGTIVDASIIAAPSSTKNQAKARDPEMQSTRKGHQWHFGMKAHIGVDSKTKLIHSVEATPANVHDSPVLDQLLHGNETRVWGDSAYTGQKDRLARAAPKARDFTHARAARQRPLTETKRSRNRTKSNVRAKVEHPFLILKRHFGGFGGSLSWHGEKRQSIVCGLCTDECSDDAERAEVTLAKRIIAAELRLIGTDRLS